MASSTHPRNFETQGAIPRLAAGIIGGLSAGIVFGAMMQTMNMMPMVAMLVGSESIALGWVVHLAISAFIGLTYSVLVRPGTGALPSALLGLGYGIVWWVLGALIIMPFRLGMGVFVLNTMAWQSLMGHMIYGVILGLVYYLTSTRLART